MKVFLQVYLPPRLKNALQRLALKTSRSASAEAAVAIEEHVSRNAALLHPRKKEAAK